MSTIIQIGSTVINFPTSGTDANWAPAIDKFAKAVESALNGIVSIYDVQPTVQTLGNDNLVDSYNLVKCTFDGANVRSFNFDYAIYRYTVLQPSTDPFSITETGRVVGVYDDLGGVWKIQHDFKGSKQQNGKSWSEFSMSGDQLVLTTTGLPNGTYDTINSKISYSARTELVSII